MLFLKEHLVGDYTWSNDDSSTLYSGGASRRKFDRFNGHQVLFMINLYGSQSDQFTLSQGRLLEELVMNQLPLEATSEITVLHWLHKTFNALPEEKTSSI